MKPQLLENENPFSSSYEQYVAIIDQLSIQACAEKSHSDMESLIEIEGRELLRRLFQESLDQRGSGEVGPCVEGSDGHLRTHRRKNQCRTNDSIFGPVTVTRTGYGQRGVSQLFPLDEPLNLSNNRYSHLLKKRVASQVGYRSYEGVQQPVKTETGVRIGKRQLETITQQASEDMTNFYQQPLAPAEQASIKDKPIQVLTFDGKGIVVREDALREATRLKAQKQSATDVPGEKKSAHRKRMAAVSAIYSIDRNVRDPDVVSKQFAPIKVVSEKAKKVIKPVAKKVWASIELSMETVVKQRFIEAKLRDPTLEKDWVVLVDGDPNQIGYAEQQAKSQGIAICLILDIMDVLEYLWKAVKVLFPDERGTCERHDWVASSIKQILHGEVRAVVADIRQRTDKKDLSDKAREPADTCANYLEKYAPYLKYDEYLKKGYPIATGIIEGACRHLVKDRMDITGARWGLAGAEAMLKMRALCINGDFERYWCYHEEQEYQRNHQSLYVDRPRPSKSKLKVIQGGKSSQ